MGYHEAMARAHKANAHASVVGACSRLQVVLLVSVNQHCFVDTVYRVCFVVTSVAHCSFGASIVGHSPHGEDRHIS